LRNDKLVGELQNLVASFRAKANQYIDIVKMGRTELQDAVPMTIGQEFHAFAASLESEISLLRDAEKYLYPVNMGATAIGTGINAPKGYAQKTAQHLAKLTGKPIVVAPDMVAATWDQQGFVVYSAALKSVAVKLSKIANDLILLTSGPRAGLAEVREAMAGGALLVDARHPDQYAGDAGAQNQDLCRWDGAGGGGHHAEEAARLARRDQHRRVAAGGGLGGERVHRLRPRRPRD